MIGIIVIVVALIVLGAGLILVLAERGERRERIEQCIRARYDW